MEGCASSPTAGSRGAHGEYALSNTCNPRMPRLDRKYWRRYDSVPSLRKGLLPLLKDAVPQVSFGHVLLSVSCFEERGDCLGGGLISWNLIVPCFWLPSCGPG